LGTTVQADEALQEATDERHDMQQKLRAAEEEVQQISLELVDSDAALEDAISKNAVLAAKLVGVTLNHPLGLLAVSPIPFRTNPASSVFSNLYRAIPPLVGGHR
jgi:hypothetical protein